MKGLDLSKFSKVGSNDTHTTFKHKDGHWIKVAHKGLSPKMKGDIDAIKLAEGGGVHEPLIEKEGTSKAGALLRTKNIPGTKELAKNEHKRTLQNLQAQPAPKLMADGGSTPPPPPPEPVTPEGISAGFKKATGFADGGALPSVEEAMQDPQAAAQGAIQGAPLDQASQEPQPSAPAPETQPDQTLAPDLGPSGPEATKKFLAQDALATENDLNQGHIKPETYQSLFAKKDTLGKIGTLFGMLVGGAGAGLSHQPSAIMEMMNKTIDNDLKAQQETAENKQNFLKIAQQNPLVQAEIKKMNADTAATTQAVAMNHTYQATFDSLVKKVQAMPEGPQKQAAQQALAAFWQNGAQKLVNAHSAAAALTPVIAGQQSPASAPEQPQSDSILKPGANIQGNQFNPIQAADRSQVNDQYTQAQQAQKALDNLKPTFDRLSGDRTVSGRIAQEASSLDNLPFGIGEALSGPFKALANLNEKNRDYTSGQTALISDITNALKGTNVHGDEISRIVKANSPVKGDSDEEIQRKIDTIKGFIKRSVPTSMLEKYGLLNK